MHLLLCHKKKGKMNFIRSKLGRIRFVFSKNGSGSGFFSKVGKAYPDPQPCTGSKGPHSPSRVKVLFKFSVSLKFRNLHFSTVYVENCATEQEGHTGWPRGLVHTINMLGEACMSYPTSKVETALTKNIHLDTLHFC